MSGRVVMSNIINLCALFQISLWVSFKLPQNRPSVKKEVLEVSAGGGGLGATVSVCSAFFSMCTATLCPFRICWPC